MTRAPQTVGAPDEPARLDELMLAMDVVDTLRHEQQLVERELAGEARADALVLRLGEIYAGQGIAVPEHVLREGVAALAEDRFAYTPPQRTFAVRLAHLYVTRAKWLPILTILLVIATAAAFAASYARDAGVTKRIRSVASSHELANDEVAAAERKLGELVLAAERWRGELSALAAANAPLQAFDNARRAAENTLAESRAALAEPREEPHDAASARFLARTAAHFGTQAREAVAGVASALEPLTALGNSDTRARSAILGIEGLDLDAPAREKFALARAEYEAALNGIDLRAISDAVTGLEMLRARLELSYELFIVSRPGTDTGFWRDAETGGRNHYIVVEARGTGGRALDLAIFDEEQQLTRTVNLFALRVPEDLFDEVRADKLDNGIVDRGAIGRKRRGAYDETLNIRAAGGRITRW